MTLNRVDAVKDKADLWEAMCIVCGNCYRFFVVNNSKGTAFWALFFDVYLGLVSGS